MINILVTYRGNGLVSCVNTLTRCEHKRLCWFHINTWWRILSLEKPSPVLKASVNTCLLRPPHMLPHSICTKYSLT